MSRGHLLPLLVVALAAAPSAFAQYQWRDANGRMVYSDLPPPASIAPSAVIRSPARPPQAGDPGGSGAAATPKAAPSAAVAPARPASPAARVDTPPSAADRELEYRKRRLERAEAERKAAEAQADARRRSAACDDARGEVRTLESGMRVARVNAAGEREVLDDAQRAARLDAARGTVRDACGAS